MPVFWKVPVLCVWVANVLFSDTERQIFNCFTSGSDLPTAFQRFKDLLDTPACQHLTLNDRGVHFSRLMHQYVMALDVLDATLEPLLATQLHLHPAMLQVKKPEGYCAGMGESTSWPKLQWNLAWWILHLSFSKTPTHMQKLPFRHNEQSWWSYFQLPRKSRAPWRSTDGGEKTKIPWKRRRNGSNKMESLTRVLEMRRRRRWKHEDKDKWAEDMFGAGEAAPETAVSGGLTQTDRAPPLRARRSRLILPLSLKKSHNMFP